jgi:hypothetical protein
VLAVHFSIETIDRAEAFTVNTNTVLSDNTSYTDGLVIDDGQSLTLGSDFSLDVTGGPVIIRPGASLMLEDATSLSFDSGMTIYGELYASEDVVIQSLGI